MTRYSVQPRYWIFVKGYGVFSFVRNIGKSVRKNISKTLSSQYSQKLFDHAELFPTDALKSTSDAIKTASKRAIKKATETTGDLIGNKIAESQKLHHRIIQKQMKKKYLEQYLYLQN